MSWWRGLFSDEGPGKMDGESIYNLLKSREAILKEAFGDRPFEIVDLDYGAAVNAEPFAIDFAIEISGLLLADIKLDCDSPDGERMGTTFDILAQFCGIRQIEVATDRRGFVVETTAQQLDKQIAQLRVFATSFLFDVTRRILAAAYAEGYNACYNDWAAGKF